MTQNQRVIIVFNFVITVELCIILNPLWFWIQDQMKYLLIYNLMNYDNNTH